MDAQEVSATHSANPVAHGPSEITIGPEPLYPAPVPPVTAKGWSYERGGCERPRCPRLSQRVAADRPKREDQLVNLKGVTPPAGTGCLSLKI